MKAIDNLINSFSRLPGIGKKSAARIVHHLLKVDVGFLKVFAKELDVLQESVHFCSVCGAYTDNDPCPICESLHRERNLICVVEQAQDVMTIDNSGEYRGLFHVLGGLISPLDGIGPDKLFIGKLIERLHSGEITEVIIATNPTVEGDTTALYLQRLIAPLGIKVSRLASGLPVGGDLEYADKLTLARSFRGRTAF